MDSMGTIKVARPEAKEEKKREKKLQKIELSGFSLPSPALLAVKFLRNPYFLFFLFPSFFTLSPLPKTMATGRRRNPTKKEKKERKKERHALTDMIPATIQSLPSRKIQPMKLPNFIALVNKTMVSDRREGR